jgi:hypothetical protein
VDIGDRPTDLVSPIHQEIPREYQISTYSCFSGCLPGFWLVKVAFPTERDNREDPDVDAFRRLAAV